MQHINDILSLFKIGMKCITKDDLKRFYKSGGDLMRALTSIKLDGARLHAFTSNLDVAHKSYNLKDFENIPLKEDLISYVLREVRPYVADAWVDRDNPPARASGEA